MPAGIPLARRSAFSVAMIRAGDGGAADLGHRGTPGNLQAISLLAVMDARVQARGGIASEEHVRAALGAGAQRVVLGSAALADRALTERLVARYGDALAVALEVSGGRI